MVLDFSSPEAREEKLGPIAAKVNGKYGIPPLSPGSSQNASFGAILHTLKFLSTGLMRRLKSPSPFFDTKTGKPRVEPKVLSDPEYYALIARCGPQPQIASN